jgi:protease-4
MSEANSIQYKAYLGEVYRQMVTSIQRHRGIDTATLTKLANKLSVRTAEQALQYGLIDGLLYDDQVRDTIKNQLGLSKNDGINFMSASKYIEATKQTGSGDRIAVVYADGNIVDGKGEDTEIGSETYRKLLASIRTDEKVKAVVLRVNSPGGSAIASEMIWRELELLKKEKTLVVSMGNYAASGGYYIACMADSIFALPNTLTGSIGVFTLLFDAQKLFNDKLGLNFDGVRTNTYADFGNFTRPMSDFERQVAQRDVDEIYGTFKARVMKGRNMKDAYVDSIAQGRVWSGKDATEIGLVDRIGTMDDAIACAARMAKLDKYAIREYPKRQTLIDKILNPQDDNDAETGSVKALSKQLTPQHAAWLKEYHTLTRMVNIPQARLPFLIQMP